MTQRDVLWAARVWKRRMYRCCNGSSLSPQDMHCLHWKSLEARSFFHVSHYLQGLILFDSMEEDGRCFPESECFLCMRRSYLSAMAKRWCCSISMCLDRGGNVSSLIDVWGFPWLRLQTTPGTRSRGPCLGLHARLWLKSVALVGSRQCLCRRIYAKEMAETPGAD